MHSHPLARLTPISRKRLIRRHQGEGVKRKTLAAQAGISLRCPYKGLDRYRSITASRSGVDR
ncbi:leucine zipper domain-containing protein [Cyanobium gracile UHCC 0281]|uniref:Leucine zipper domain-containing protein n=1 Tax=Cyanobium gracile UHCC 0281 TaxID=3110309 RepID=A0ABU5SWC7_9CYAN|nr:leucine zipper domain-containing protein [Cyanobium gracile]MEA5442822.1 leucine zipper domain-containing protein [Cyanobium gracile UHCC 0281]